MSCIAEGSAAPTRRSARLRDRLANGAEGIGEGGGPENEVPEKKALRKTRGAFNEEAEGSAAGEAWKCRRSARLCARASVKTKDPDPASVASAEPPCGRTRKRDRSPVEPAVENDKPAARKGDYASPREAKKKRVANGRAAPHNKAPVTVLLSDDEGEEVQCELRPGGSISTAAAFLAQSPARALSKMSGSSVKRTRHAGKENDSGGGGEAARSHRRRSNGEALQPCNLNALSFSGGEGRRVSKPENSGKKPSASPSPKPRKGTSDNNGITLDVEADIEMEQQGSTAVAGPERSGEVGSVCGGMGPGLSGGVAVRAAGLVPVPMQLEEECGEVDPQTCPANGSLGYMSRGAESERVVPPFPLPGSSLAFARPSATPYPGRPLPSSPQACACSAAQKDDLQKRVQVAPSPPLQQHLRVPTGRPQVVVPPAAMACSSFSLARSLFGGGRDLDLGLAPSSAPVPPPAPLAIPRNPPQPASEKAAAPPHAAFSNRQMSIGEMGGIFQMLFPPVIPTSPRGPPRNGSSFSVPLSPTASSLRSGPVFGGGGGGNGAGILSLPQTVYPPFSRGNARVDTVPVSPGKIVLTGHKRRGDEMNLSPKMSPAKKIAAAVDYPAASVALNQRAPSSPVSGAAGSYAGILSLPQSAYPPFSGGSPRGNARAVDSVPLSPGKIVLSGHKHRGDQMNHSPRKSPAKKRAAAFNYPTTSRRRARSSPVSGSAGRWDGPGTATSGCAQIQKGLLPCPLQRSGLSFGCQPPQQPGSTRVHFVFDTSALQGCFESAQGHRLEDGFRALFGPRLRDDVRVVIPMAARIQLDTHKSQRGGGEGGGGHTRNSNPALARKAFLARQASRMLEELLHPETRPTLLFQDRREFDEAWAGAKRGGCEGVDPYDACIVECAAARRRGGVERVVVVSGDRNMRIDSRTHFEEEPHLLAVGPYELYDWLEQNPSANVGMLWGFLATLSHFPSKSCR